MANPEVVINPRFRTWGDLREEVLARYQLNATDARVFDALNPHLAHRVVAPGNLVLIPERGVPACGAPLQGSISQLQHQAWEVQTALTAHGAPNTDVLVENRETISMLLYNASIATGMASEAWSRHLVNIASTLADIDKLHAVHSSNGKLVDRDGFLSKRAALFAKLDRQLEGVLRIGSGLRKRTTIKKMLGISTQRYLDKGEIRRYVQRIAGVTKAAKLIDRGSYIGVALSTTSTLLDIRNACMTGREEACRKAKVVEGSKLAGSLAGGIAAGLKTSKHAPKLCLAVGFITRHIGYGACVVITGGAGAVIGGDLGSSGGELIGERVYEAAK